MCPPTPKSGKILTFSKLGLHQHCHLDDHRDAGDHHLHLELLLHLHQLLLHNLLLPLLRVGQGTPRRHLCDGGRDHDHGSDDDDIDDYDNDDDDGDDDDMGDYNDDDDDGDDDDDDGDDDGADRFWSLL